MTFEQPPHLDCPIDLRLRQPRGGFATTRKRFGEHEEVGRAGSFVFLVDTPRVIHRRLDRRTSFLDPRHRLFIHAQHWTSRIIRLFVRFQDFLSIGDELSIGLRRDHLVLDLPVGHPVF